MRSKSAAEAAMAATALRQAATAAGLGDRERGFRSSGMGCGDAELLFDLAGAARWAGGLVAGANEELELIVARRAEVFVDRHDDFPGVARCDAVILYGAA